MGNAKLVVLQARGDVGVCFGVDVGVHANADRGDQPQGQGDLVDDFKLRRALHVEAQNSLLQSPGDLTPGFTNTREDHVFGQSASRQDSLEFSL